MKNNTMAVSKTLLVAGALLASGAAQASDVAIAARASTLGLGGELKYAFHDKFNGRFVFNNADKSYEETGDSGNQYSGDLELKSYGLIGDWHPAGNGFRLSAGLYSNGNSLKARTEGGMFSYGDDDYVGNAGIDVDFKSVAPYLGLGWSSQKPKGWSFAFEVGALLQGTPELSGSGNAEINNNMCNFTVNDNGVATVTGNADCDSTDPNNIVAMDLKDALEAEHADLQGDLDDFKIYPVLSFGIQYRF